MKRRKSRKSKKYKKRRKSRRSFGDNMGPKIYNARMQDGILLADNAFSWMGNPEARALMS